VVAVAVVVDRHDRKRTMRTLRTAADSVCPVWLSFALAASVMGGCQLGGGTYYLEVHNRTAVPIQMQGSSWVGSWKVIASCESAEFAWGPGAVSNIGSSPPPTPPADVVMVEIPVHMSPPADPRNDRTQSLIVSAEGVSGYEGASVPSMPPCEGRPPAE